MKLNFLMVLILSQNIAVASVTSNEVSSLIENLETFDDPTPTSQCLVQDKKPNEICAQMESLLAEYKIASSKRDLDSRSRLDKELRIIYPQCMDVRFKDCYPNLKPSINLNNLKKVFSELKKDPRFRYPNGGMGMCHYRAENLSYYFAEAGFKTRTIRIGRAPTLIAMDRDLNGNLNGNFDDYHGSHTLVQIEVEINGKTVPYLLDPQYMEEALPNDEYFLKTIGQVCTQVSPGEKVEDYTTCTYHEEKQNKPAENGFHADKPEDAPYLACGWSGGASTEARVDWTSVTPSPKKDKLIVCTNGNTPELFINKVVSEATPKELIWNAYLSYEKRLQEDLAQAKQQVELQGDNPMSGDSPFERENKESYLNWVAHQENLEYSLQQIPAMLERVKKNLK